MKLRYSNTIEDVVAFGRYHRRHSRTHRLLLAILRWGLPGLFVLSVPCLTFDSWASVVYYFFPAVVLVLGAGWLVRVVGDLSTRASYREGDNKGLLGPHELELCPPNLTERNLVGESTRWLGAVEKIGPTPTHAFIYLSALSAHVVPRAAVTDGDYDAFVRALEQEVEKARRGRPAPPAWLGGERPATRSAGDERVSDQPSI